MKRIDSPFFQLAILLLLLSGCKGYKQNIMLQVPEEYDIEQINEQSFEVGQQYVINPYDQISVEVYTNDGERIIDPDFELVKDIAINQVNSRPEINYQVIADGTARLPMIGQVKVSELSIREVENFLQTKYQEFYTNPFVVVRYLNKRVTVVGDVNSVVPLVNEDVHLIEILALADAVSNNAKVQNIRVVRGDDVYVADLSTIEGMKATNMIVQPDDIIYVEPVRRPFVESVRDYGPVISVVTSITAIIAILTRR